MILWHSGMTLLLARYIFGDPRMDLRVLVLGGLLPDLIDKPIGSILFLERFGSGRVVAHSLLFSAVVMTAVLVMTRRGSAARRRWMALPIGSLLHLVLDIPIDPVVLFWPGLGGFPRSRYEGFSELIPYLTDHFWVVAQELVGLGVLVWMWRKAGLGSAARRRQFITTGVID